MQLSPCHCSYVLHYSLPQCACILGFQLSAGKPRDALREQPRRLLAHNRRYNQTQSRCARTCLCQWAHLSILHVYIAMERFVPLAPAAPPTLLLLLLHLHIPVSILSILPVLFVAELLLLLLPPPAPASAPAPARLLLVVAILSPAFALQPAAGCAYVKSHFYITRFTAHTAKA